MLLFRLAVFAILLAVPSLSSAQSADPDPSLGVELNAAETTQSACRLTFVLRNETGQQIDSFIAETVLFSAGGDVLLLTLFDFGGLPAGRPRVRQFEVPGTACDTLGMVLVNGVDTCIGGTLNPATCEASLSLASRTEIELAG